MRVRCLPLVDALERDGELVVMADDRVILLSELASCALTLAETSHDLSSLAAELVARFGPPPHGDEISAARSVLEELASHGLVTLEE